ncbi:hypothetical protein GGR58DRAFT_497452 [Xylaria digitata]|nr:hypothetical protein GGR58DRAFT_497452 [Xylaria digitata]
MSSRVRNRVCDRCIRKKVKCDLQRPDCSRCLEAGSPCTYSAERKKPGIISPDAIEGLCLPQGEAGGFESFSLHDLIARDAPIAEVVHPNSQYPGYSLGREQERDLLVHFFGEVHPAIPLFRIDHFLKKYDDGLAEKALLVAIVTVAAKVLSPISFWKPEDVEQCMKFLLETTSPETVSQDTHNSLDSFRLECLLAYYEFHQFPGSSSWMRISRLARRAYSVGVNQVDNPELCSAFDCTITTEDEIEDWRYLFWCIYCLDSYSNISVGTPFVVELESINTALARNPHDQAHGLPNSVSKIFLPDDIEDIWKTAKEIVSNGVMVNYNLHMVTTTTLRQAGYIMRLRALGKRLTTKKITTLKCALATLRLSLPSRYLNPARNVLSGESCIDHHIRLTNILHLHMAHLIIAIPPRLDENEAEFMQNWLESLEPCQNIVSVVEHWDNQHSPRIDPAICLIAFTALCFLELHRWSTADPTASLIASLSHGQHLLLLFLEQFSSMWAVPRCLIQQFQKVQDKYRDTRLTYAEIDQQLSRFKTPLHPKTLERSSAISTTAPDTNTNNDTTMHIDDIWSFDVYDFSL